jgi:hypothetical protein
MSSENDTTTTGSSGSDTTRRRYLAALAGAAALTAGCSDVTSQSFEASAVVLPSEDQEALRLAETSRDERTISREGPSGNVEVSITNRAAIYSHAAGYGGS